MSSKIKQHGQVYTPLFLVRNILDFADYSGEKILGKHIMENSCGDGAFLCEIAERYCKVFLSRSTDKNRLSKELAQYIHGIEIDREAYTACLQNLRFIEKAFDLPKVNWDILHADTLQVDKFDDKMDFVVGNPPYVRVHNLSTSYTRAKSFNFANGGMTDLYLVFFEIGLRMLKSGGRLSYITPSSWLNSLAGNNMRCYLNEKLCLSKIADLAHFQPFKATTYTVITLLEKGKKHDFFNYYTYDSKKQEVVKKDTLQWEKAYIEGNLFLANKAALSQYSEIIYNQHAPYVEVKNGFATLSDAIFIRPQFDFRLFVIPVLKASTGKWYEAFFPYDEKGNPKTANEIFKHKEVASYLNEHKHALLKGEHDFNNPNWFLYGRTQALKDVRKEKIAINTCIKDLSSLKINEVKAGRGVYSGLYILGADLKTIRSILHTKEFIEYLHVIKKYKSGGYYTFSSKDLERYLNYHLTQRQTAPHQYEQPRFSESYLRFI